MCEICSKLIIKFQRYRSGAFIGNFEQSLHVSGVSIFDLKKVSDGHDDWTWLDS